LARIKHAAPAGSHFLPTEPTSVDWGENSLSYRRDQSTKRPPKRIGNEANAIPALHIANFAMVDTSNIWTPLDPAKREIRLLHLAPSENIDDQPKCFLENISVNDNPQYEALSYAWGDVKVTQPIDLQDVQREVTENLEAAL